MIEDVDRWLKGDRVILVMASLYTLNMTKNFEAKNGANEKELGRSVLCYTKNVRRARLQVLSLNFQDREKCWRGKLCWTRDLLA